MTSRRQGDGFAGPGGHSANLEAWRSFLRGSWHLCTPSLRGVDQEGAVSRQQDTSLTGRQRQGQVWRLKPRRDRRLKTQEKPEALERSVE